MHWGVTPQLNSTHKSALGFVNRLHGAGRCSVGLGGLDMCTFAAVNYNEELHGWVGGV